MKISIITPSFNSANYIESAIKSVQEQSFDNWEHIVVDGLSTDGTQDILKRYPKVRWVSEPDDGQSGAMNKGFAMSTGDVVVYLNADDYFLPGAFDSVVELFEDGARFVVGDVLVISEDGREQRISPRVTLREMIRHWEPWEQNGDRFVGPYPNNPVQYFYTREVQEALPFNENNHNTMDLEFILKASREFEFKKIDTLLGVYRLRDEAKSVMSQRECFKYWSPDNFYYLDDVTSDWGREELIAFKNAQMSGYVERIREGLFWSAGPVRKNLQAYFSTSSLNVLRKLYALRQSAKASSEFINSLASTSGRR